jgi:hypothetical protein
MSVLIRSDGGAWREPSEHGYENEATLQEILYQHPALVPGIKGAAVACKEFQSGIGPADVVVLNEEGVITLVECKLASNPQVRREITGQVLDYASRMWRMPVDEFERLWIKASTDKISPFTALGDEEGRLRAIVEENLDAGRFNLVLAVDRLSDDLRRIVEFLNEVTVASTGVIAVEYQHLREGDVEMLIPSSYGAELVEAKTEAKSHRPAWTIEQYFDWVDEHDPEGSGAVRGLVQELESVGFLVYGGKASTPSLNCGLDVPFVGRRYPVCMYTNEKRGALVEVRFTDFKKYPEITTRLVDRLREIPDLPIPLHVVIDSGFTRRPNISAREFTVEAATALPLAVRTALFG